MLRTPLSLIVHECVHHLCGSLHYNTIVDVSILFFYINILLYKLCQNKCSREARVFLGIEWKVIYDKRNRKRGAVEKL